MKSLISRATSALSSLLNALQAKRVLAVALVGFVLLTTTNVAPGRTDQNLTNRIDQLVHQGNSDRPKTTGEWNAEARNIDSLDERLENIAGESAEAIKDFGSLYPDTAERSNNSLQNDAPQSNSGFPNPFQR